MKTPWRKPAPDPLPFGSVWQYGDKAYASGTPMCVMIVGPQVHGGGRLAFVLKTREVSVWWGLHDDPEKRLPDWRRIE